MRKLSNSGAMSEARRFKTLTLSRSAGSGVGVAMPQPTAQNQMIIASAVPAWALLAAPSAQYQVLITGADPYTQAWAPLFDIVPTWTALHTFSGGSPTNQHAVSYRRILLEDDGSANLQIVSEDGSQDGCGLVLSRAPAAGNNTHWVMAHRLGGFSIGYRSTTSSFSINGVTEHLTFSATGYLRLRVADNVALAAKLEDVGYTEYWRVVSTDAQPAFIFNNNNADIDFRVGASGQANALFVQGSSGNIGVKTNDPATDWHIVGSTVANKHYSNYRTQILEDNNVVLQLIGTDSSSAMTHVILTGAPAAGDNKHWIVSHLGPDLNNRFSIGYKTSSADNFTAYNPTEYLTISTAGAVHIRESSATVRLSGTKEFVWIIPDPAVEVVGQVRIPWDCTVIRVDANTITGTCTFNPEERGTLGSAGTNILSSDMVADINGESVTSGFNNASLAAGNYLAIDVSAISGTASRVTVNVTVTLD